MCVPFPLFFGGKLCKILRSNILVVFLNVNESIWFMFVVDKGILNKILDISFALFPEFWNGIYYLWMACQMQEMRFSCKRRIINNKNF